ncbi:MAG: alpha/beta hydrolase [Pseudomonadota bacterium]|nr:alpha/beta hydrolase [Pseudomonadota bacterium]
MRLDPDAQLVIDMMRAAGRPPFEQLTPEEARAAYAASRAVLQPEPDEVAEIRDLGAPGPLGDVPLRLYRPRLDQPTDSGAGTLPGLVYFHGGGWLLGGIDSHDVICRRLANLAGCIVVSVDYRMAPEHKFPAAVLDSAAATRWVIEGAAQLGIDPARVAVGGDSAGGNLAAVMALLARDGALPALAFQLLVYPATDMMMTTVSSQTVRDGVPLTSDTMRWFIDHYMRDANDRNDWRASPLRAVDLSGTAPAFVLTASHDPLCDEGIEYARRLEREGVRVIHVHLSDQVHGYLSMGRIIRASDVSLQMMAAVLKTALATRP